MSDKLHTLGQLALRQGFSVTAEYLGGGDYVFTAISNATGRKATIEADCRFTPKQTVQRLISAAKAQSMVAQA